MAEDMVPGPDPSSLTTEQLMLGLKNLRELLETRINAVEEAAHLRYDDLRRVPTETDRQVTNLKEFTNEKLISVQKQFEERDIRGQAAGEAAELAVNAALQAQKEAAAAQNNSNAAAITKSEAATIKQIDGILALLTSNTIGTNDKIAAINARLDRGDGINRGGHETRSESRMTTGVVVAVLSLAVMAVSVAAGLFGFAVHH
jgi:hypothetical protein